jgi:hypothetical protein
MKKIKILTYLFSPIFLLIGFFLLFSSYSKINNFVKVPGKVTGIDHIHTIGQRIKDYYYPQISFVTPNGQTVKFDYTGIDFAGLNGWNYRIGDQLPVLYNPKNPSEALVNNIFSLWFWPLIILLIGIGSTVLAIAIRSKATKLT